MMASTIASTMASSFCMPWNVFLFSGLVKSSFSKPAPVANCRKMEARTMGPIPAVMSEPVRLPRRISRRSKRWMPVPTPKGLIWPRT
ncbi:Uncharacterised protein [uncultured archaeon]|nr:Uncharacterised protein [uncultured archaeon]